MGSGEWLSFDLLFASGFETGILVIVLQLAKQREAAAGYTTLPLETGLNLPQLDPTTGLVIVKANASVSRPSAGAVRSALVPLVAPIPVKLGTGVGSAKPVRGAGLSTGARLRRVRAEYQPSLALNVWLRAGSALSSAPEAQRAPLDQWATLAVHDGRWDLFVSNRWRFQWLLGVPASEVTSAELSTIYYGNYLAPSVVIRSHGVAVATFALASPRFGTGVIVGYGRIDPIFHALQREIAMANSPRRAEREETR